MKYLIVLFLSIFSLSAFAGGGDDKISHRILVEPEVIITSIDSDVFSADIFNSVHYDTKETNLEFSTCEKVSVIRIFNEVGMLEFQLPVMSKNITLSKNLFGQGKYILGFIIEGQQDVHLTHVNFL